MPKPLGDYLIPADVPATTALRIFEHSKVRFDLLRRRLALATSGRHWTQAQVVEYLLDLAEGREELAMWPVEEQNG